MIEDLKLFTSYQNSKIISILMTLYINYLFFTTSPHYYKTEPFNYTTHHFAFNKKY